MGPAHNLEAVSERVATSIHYILRASRNKYGNCKWFEVH